MLQPALTERLGVKHPIVQAPMGGVAGPELAAAVSAAGALGMLTAGPSDGPDKVARDAEAMRATGERFGIGTLAWRLDEEPDLLDAVLDAEPAAVSISAGDVAPHHEAVLTAVDVPVLAAGGIASGRGLAGVLAMGAAGAWIGTRFAATVEALGGDERKRRLVAAR